MNRSIHLFLLIITLLACTVRNQEDVHSRYSIPPSRNDGWVISTPEPEGMNIDLLEDLLEQIVNDHYKNIHNILIVKNGKLVLDELFKKELTVVDSYVNNIDLEVHAMMSVTKSIVSLLTGIAIEKGILSGTEERVYSFFPEYGSFKNWGHIKQSITVKNFLTMRHGLLWDETSVKYTDPLNTYNQMEKNQDWVKFTLERPVDSLPGQKFSYSTGASHTIAALVSNASGLSFPEFADQYLFGNLGITRIAWYTAPNGRADDVYLTVRDMAKFGHLVLDGGRWKGVQLVPEAWIPESTSKILDISKEYGYGYFWWHYTFLHNGKEYPAILAWGYGGQFIFIFRDLNMVICFTSGNYTTGLSLQPFEMISRYILPSIR